MLLAPLLGLAHSVGTPPHLTVQKKMLLSATFTSPSVLRGQRPRGAHGPSAAFQDGQPPALASAAVGQLPGAGVNTAETLLAQDSLIPQDLEPHQGD